MLLSQADYARARGVSKQAIGQAVRSGKIVLHDGKIDAAEADLSWAGGKQEPVSSAGAAFNTTVPQSNPQPQGFPAPHQSRAVKAAYEARLSKLEFEQRSGKLVEIAVVNAFVAGMIMRARDELARIGAELSEELAQQSDAIKIRALIDDRISQVLLGLSEYSASA